MGKYPAHHVLNGRLFLKNHSCQVQENLWEEKVGLTSRYCLCQKETDRPGSYIINYADISTIATPKINTYAKQSGSGIALKSPTQILIAEK